MNIRDLELKHYRNRGGSVKALDYFPIQNNPSLQISAPNLENHSFTDLRNYLGLSPLNSGIFCCYKKRPTKFEQRRCVEFGK